MALVEACADQDDMAVDLHARLPFRLLEIGRFDVAKVGDMLEIEAHSLAHEHVERHLIDGGAAPLGVDERVDVRSHVIDHAEVRRASAERVVRGPIAPCDHFIMREVGENDGPREEPVPRHVVGKRYCQVHDLLWHPMHSSVAEYSAKPRSTLASADKGAIPVALVHSGVTSSILPHSRRLAESSATRRSQVLASYAAMARSAPGVGRSR